MKFNKTIWMRLIIFFLILLSVALIVQRQFLAGQLTTEEGNQENTDAETVANPTPLITPSPEIIYIEKEKITPVPTSKAVQNTPSPTQAPTLQQTASVESICSSYINEVKGAMVSISGLPSSALDFNSGYYAYALANLNSCCLQNSGNTSSCTIPSPP